MGRRCDDGEVFHPGAALYDAPYIRVSAVEELCCRGANTSPVRLFTSLLTANNGLFQEVCLPLKQSGEKKKSQIHSNERLSDCMRGSGVLEQ